MKEGRREELEDGRSGCAFVMAKSVGVNIRKYFSALAECRFYGERL